MISELTLRKASPDDAEVLLAWRNNPTTRSESHNVELVSEATHISWLNESLQNPNRLLYMAIESGSAVGTVRADWDDGCWVISWTVAPQARGRGVATRMVSRLASKIDEAIRAEVKVGNLASAKVAMRAGMQMIEEIKGVLHFRREAVS